MIEVLVRNAEGNLTNSDREYASKKLSRLDRYFHAASKVEMVHREEKHAHHLAHRVEITVFADGMFVRGEDWDHDLRAAIDKVTEKLENRLRKFKSRLVDRHRKRGHHAPPALNEAQNNAQDDESGHIRVVETKQFHLQPMSIDEAGLQMEMLGHPFFMFLNEDTLQAEVLYKRNDGQYGILQPTS